MSLGHSLDDLQSVRDGLVSGPAEDLKGDNGDSQGLEDGVGSTGSGVAGRCSHEGLA
jgi:hypothetical protein